MAFVQFTRVSLAFGDRDILKDVSLNLSAGSRAALAGANGSGKSTLMKVIAGQIQPDSGERAVQRECRLSYLPQSGIVHSGRTLREEAETAYVSIQQLISRMEALGTQLEQVKDDTKKTTQLLEEYHVLHEAIEASGYYQRSQRIAMVLTGLGFSEDDLDRPVDEFSGGWQMRIALAKVLLEAPDILLLDEPTNYLDIEARTWLEEWLKDFKGGYLLVSHDRYFLDVTVNEVYELFQGNLKRYAGNYSNYEQIRKVELESLLARYEAQQEEIAKTEDFIRRFRYNASKAAMVQDRVKRLEKMERIEIPESLKRIHFSFPPPPHSGRLVLILQGLGKKYGSRQALYGVDLVVEAGEKLLVVGRNGAGKSTLLRILAGIDQDYEGQLSLGTGVAVGYFSQDVAETLTGSQSVLETLEAEAPLELIPKLRDMLGAFLFRGDDVYKAVSVLSGGEKSRLSLLRLLLYPVNLLILDEPTNHLDLHSKDVLLDALKSYPGTVVFVSHDRAFMEALSTKTLELNQGRPRLFYGNYTYYLERLAGESAGGAENPGSSAGSSTGSSPRAGNRAGTGSVAGHGSNTAQSSATGGAGLSAADYREAEKKRQAQIRRLERQEADLLAQLEQCETEKARLEEALASPEIYADGTKVRDIQSKLDGILRKIDELTIQWEQVAQELETVRQG
ncbi:ABC-F family ATP-binding cassette domain-containing protein [Gracilinema caldarium]|uniref:ABC transporter related protein n=1 Tax=Gracilinema caldarium (strain ATCC 51460 / DSM 7334 / H1) TaxID=744872 RepID=F8EYV8_GRAC1|nr:ABC-F family ATP-binding cassette domain-containing protein [Gracilinema caldarium]AEJ18904.1 ABC transporter related protein [Gracilinema caldarium DSM 7334]